jgi:hypothetical protein
MNLVGLTTEKHAELASRTDDRLKRLVENALHGVNVVSTNSLVELIGVPKTTGNARRVAKIMRALNFVPIKSRRLRRGFDSGTRGWARARQKTAQQANQVDKYILLKGGLYDSVDIVHVDANSSVGGARPLPDGRFIVANEDCEEVDIVNSLDEAIPAISSYYKVNPPQWELEPQPDFRHTDVKADGPHYMKESPFGPFIVFRIESGEWVAFRNDCELLFDGKIATFATREEAQCKADIHERDGYPNSEATNDGYSWIFSEYRDWRQNPHVVANRAYWLCRQTSTNTVAR